MTAEKMIEVFMADGCSKADAEYFVNGSYGDRIGVVYDDPEDYIYNENVFHEEAGEDLISLNDAREGKLKGVHMVTLDGHEYLISYD
jgi:hypothetical protein